jgi:hypothetical protein
MSKTMKVMLVGALLLALSAGMATAQFMAQDVITCSKAGPRGATVRRVTTGSPAVAAPTTSARVPATI